MAVVKTNATRRVIKQFADAAGFVYFGHVTDRSDEHKLVRGITLDKGHIDRHYTIGTFQTYDSVLLQRTVDLSYPHSQPQKYTWLILQMDLHITEKLPHVFIGWPSFGNMFYANLPLSFPHLKPVSIQGFSGYSTEFTSKAVVYTPEGHLEIFKSLVEPDAADTITERFNGLGFEIDGDQLYVYACNSITTRRLLDSMFQAGLWMADYLSPEPETEDLEEEE